MNLQEERELARTLNAIDAGEVPAWLLESTPAKDQSWVIGVTGSPGVGKSTLVGSLIEHLLELDLSVGVIAVDPTSPFTRGAFLGDRIRMQRSSLHPNLFIRSVGSHDSVGGLNESVYDMVSAMEAFGKQIIIVETVGAGQSDVDVMYVADSVLLVVSPGAGDEVQVYKAGIMEIADIYVINKSDLPGSQKMIHDIQEILDNHHTDEVWKRRYACTQAHRSVGIPQLWSEIEAHQSWLMSSSERASRRTRREKKRLEVGLSHHLKKVLDQIPQDQYPLFRVFLEQQLKAWHEADFQEVKE